MRRRLLHALLITEIVLVLSSSCLCMSDRRDPSTGKIRVLNMGADAVPGTASPLVVLFTDPLIQHQTVPLYSSIFEAVKTERFMRIYMPRTEERMKSDFDLIMISDATVDNFPIKYFPWIISAVRDEGLGFFTTGGSAMYGGRDQYGSWDSCSIVEIYAVSFAPRDIYFIETGRNAPVKLAPAQEDNEFVSSIPWDTAPAINYMIHIVQTKQGASTLLTMDIPQAHPTLSSWDYGEGRATNLIFDWYPWRLEAFQKWVYYIDFAGNLIYYSAGVSVPQDLEMVHKLRRLLGDYMEKRTLLISLLAFVEKFGAKVGSVERGMAVLDSDFSRSQQLYRDQDWEGAQDLLQDMMSRMSKLDDDALKLKDRALMWIYISEWLTVTATLSISGFVLWSLMVRRRLYGEVGVTRLR